MKHLNTILSLTLLCVLSSLSTTACGLTNNKSKGSQDKPIVITIGDLGFDVKDYFSEKAAFHFSDLFSKVEYVTLESTDLSTLSNIDKMEITPSGDFLIFDLLNSKIVRFDSKGKFLNEIGCRGKAKNEYLYAVDMMYNPLEDEVVVVDLPSTTLKFYHLDGTYIKGLKINSVFRAVGVIDKEHIATFLDYVATGQSPDNDYNLKVYDLQGNLLEQYDSFLTDRKQFSTNALEAFKYQNGRLLYNPHYTSTIFSFEAARQYPVYQLDFGKKSIPASVIQTSANSRELRKWLYDHESLYCRKFFEGTKYYVMQLIANGSESILYLVDKKNLQKKFAGTFGYNNMSGLLENNILTHFHNDKIYYVFDPSVVQTVLDNIHSNRAEVEKHHGKISDADIAWLEKMAKLTNPIVQICTLK